MNMRLRSVCLSLCFSLAAVVGLAAASPASAQSPTWRTLLPDTIGRMVVKVQLSGDSLVRLSIDTVGSKFTVTTEALPSDSLLAWAKSVDAIVADSLKPKADAPKEFRLASSILATRDSVDKVGRAFRLLVADSAGDSSFAALVPYAHMTRVLESFVRKADPAPASGKSGGMAMDDRRGNVIDKQRTQGR